MTELVDFVAPELIILIPCLYVLAEILKRAGILEVRYIPLTLLGVGVVLATVYEIAMKGLSLESVCVGIIQGVLVTGCATLVYDVYKTTIGRKAEE